MTSLTGGTDTILVTAIPDSGLRKTVILGGEILLEVAARLKVPAIQNLTAEYKITRNGELTLVKGQLEAELTRICVSSLEEMTEVINSPFEIEFLPEEEIASRHTEEEFSIEEDEPEPLAGDELDLAEITVQQLSLEMTPYPKKQGASSLIDEVKPQDVSPFAALQQLKGNRE